MDDAVEIDSKIILERQIAQALVSIDRELLHDTTLKCSDTANFLANKLTFSLRKLIWANPLGRMVVEYPASPWEHFRSAYFPKWRIGRWFLRRKPIRNVAVVRSAYATFPETHMTYPPELGRMTIALREKA